jgi:PAS domain S-box-containing protein
VEQVRASAVTPTGAERTFRDDEIIVSKTDLQGRMTYVNDVFLGISGYTEDELIGKPHSLIRHPDMPRAVFKLLWDTLASGSEIFAYVVNLAATGDHYWVLAHVTPTFGPDGTVVGYHSNRRTASRAAVAQVEPLYRALLEEERRHEHTPSAIAASTAMLLKTLQELGTTYDEWVWSLSDEEVAA